MIEYSIKILHVLAIISWMAGLLYLPRLFVYHADVAAGSEPALLFVTMERRLYRAIMTPAMIVAWITGLWMAWHNFGFAGGWLQAKIVLVLAMSAHHGLQGSWLRKLREGTNIHPARFFRIHNEVPTVLMIGIVILVIAKPF